MNQPQRVFDVLYFQQVHYPKDVAVANIHNGKIDSWSTEELIKNCRKLALRLMQHGLKKEDKVGIISNNCREWNVVDFGSQHIGAITVPVYPTITADDYAYIFGESEVSIVFCEDKELADKASEGLEKAGIDAEVICFLNDQGYKYFYDYLDELELTDELVDDLEKAISSVSPEDLLTIIYTSGTTGKPKGVMLNHSNILSNLVAVSKIFPKVKPAYQCKALSFLPLCHIFERTASGMYIYLGVSIYYAESMDTIGENLKLIKPQLFTTVPRLLEKIYQKIVAKGLELSGLKKALFFWAIDLADEYDTRGKSSFYKFKLKIARKLIFSKWQEALGNEILFIVSGAAALQSKITRAFFAADMPVIEAYGQTETSPGVSFSLYDDPRIGCVGPALDKVNVKIADDGEILVKGPNVMKGYYKQPELTAEAFDEDGWLKTGDIGEFVDNKYLKITDRKKEMFKTSGGKYIAPQVIENALKESPFIEHCMVVGEGERFPGAIILPDFESLKSYASSHNIPFKSNYDLIEKPKIQELIKGAVDKMNNRFAQYEKIKKYELTADDWGIESGELTPTLKLRRRVLNEKYKSQIENIYKE
ncbi:AMP-dependent synthetase/ligase [Marinigracilibium pacificum]|uniref:Long-chain fatty acid--CoA ligase n=1 Tax=Marinigracilibium pacificum TaxID=2729599 RepID=A0A848J1C5_9BACT|nr:long-chain fatty acid--CoA ligase [Marinigracilibium pacificum]NMM47032.1 long-chain fatty acid--CoA ligase [Marinigracilibium pacificum]